MSDGNLIASFFVRSKISRLTLDIVDLLFAELLPFFKNCDWMLVADLKIDGTGGSRVLLQQFFQNACQQCNGRCLQSS